MFDATTYARNFSMRLYLGLGLFAFTLTELVGPSLAQAAVANCMSLDGSCEVNNDMGDFVACECADGSGGAGGGGNDWAGLSDLELQPICDEQLAMFCGPPPPPSGIPCASPAGSCFIDNVPEDSLSCECADGSGGGMAGGMMWAGYSDMELLAECEIELDLFCGPPPPPAGLECSNRLGDCTISNDPTDWIECTCADGEGFAGGGGMMWAGLSDDELVLECEAQLDDGCAIGGSEGSTGDPGTSGTGGTGDPGETEGTGGTGAGSTGGHDTGMDESGGASEGSSGAGPGTTTGDGATGSSEGSESGADGGGGGTSGCSVAPRSAASGWALALLGLLGLGRRRRQRAG